MRAVLGHPNVKSAGCQRVCGNDAQQDTELRGHSVSVTFQIDHDLFSISNDLYYSICLSSSTYVIAVFLFLPRLGDELDWR